MTVQCTRSDLLFPFRDVLGAAQPMRCQWMPNIAAGLVESELFNAELVCHSDLL